LRPSWESWESLNIKGADRVKAIVLSVLLLGASFRANAAESWTCTYPDYSTKRNPVLVRYDVDSSRVVEHSKLIRMDWTEEFKVLKNDKYALIAASSQTGHEQGQTDAFANSVTIVIAKETGTYIRSNTFLLEKDFGGAPIKGECWKN
jgi:hypothetical protein